jgi:hypothetical protein
MMKNCLFAMETGLSLASYISTTEAVFYMLSPAWIGQSA